MTLDEIAPVDPVSRSTLFPVCPTAYPFAKTVPEVPLQVGTYPAVTVEGPAIPPDGAKAAHVPSPRQNVADDAPVPLAIWPVAMFPVMLENGSVNPGSVADESPAEKTVEPLTAILRGICAAPP
jgi:hypothetical protein